MTTFLTEENGAYGIDCSRALWATSEIHGRYNEARIHVLKDADFIIETAEELYIVEYKNALIANAANPSAFQPYTDKHVNAIASKFYDTLHYLALMQKQKPIRYIYVIEAENSDSTMRLRLRDRIAKELPFALQMNMNTGKKLIDGLDVLSIAEWNSHERYSLFPICEVTP